MKSERSRSRMAWGQLWGSSSKRGELFDYYGNEHPFFSFLQLVGLLETARAVKANGGQGAAASGLCLLASLFLEVHCRRRCASRARHPTPSSTPGPLSGKRVSEAVHFFPSFLSPHPRKNPSPSLLPHDAFLVDCQQRSAIHSLLTLTPLLTISRATNQQLCKSMEPAPGAQQRKSLSLLLDSFKSRCSSHA